ncbi:hypothetical protein ACWC5I_15300, partial [Kitasatospora sp. NPDC001574]
MAGVLDTSDEGLGGQAGAAEFAAGGGLGEALVGYVAAGLGVGEHCGEGGPVGLGEDPRRVVGDGGADVAGEGVAGLLLGLALGEEGELVGGGLVV